MTHPLHQFKFCPKCGSTFHENNFKSNKCDHCGFIYYMNTSAAVAVFILNNKGELLVCRRAHEPAINTLDLPGGFVDLYESAESAAIREVKEETGLEVMTLNYQFSLPNQYLYSDFDVHTLDLFYTATVKNSSILLANDDVAETFFIPIDQLKPELFGLRSIKLAIQKFITQKDSSSK